MSEDYESEDYERIGAVPGIHHQRAASDASGAAVNATVAMRAVARKTGLPEDQKLAELCQSVARMLGQRMMRARDSHTQICEENPALAARCAEGLEPWPDESISIFQAPCTCYNICRVHYELDHDEYGILIRGDPLDEGAQLLAQVEGWQCICKPCPLHKTIDEEEGE